jgi:hypothetical protein
MAAVVFSVVFVFSHLEHTCTGAYCPVCIRLEGAGNLIKHLGIAGTALVAAFTGFCRIRGLLKCRLFIPPSLTAIRLKVQFNN